MANLDFDMTANGDLSETIQVLSAPKDHHASIFLAGGISGCPDWQSEFIGLLDGRLSVTILNPRRESFPMGDQEAGKEQIKWEYRHLRRADVIVFWFCAETLQPIALFELGAWSMVQSKPLFVGAHPDYERRFDVVQQLGLVRPDVKVAESLPELATEVLTSSPLIRHEG